MTDGKEDPLSARIRLLVTDMRAEWAELDRRITLPRRSPPRPGRRLFDDEFATNAKLLGAERVIAIDQLPERLALAEKGGARRSTSARTRSTDRFQEMKKGRGPDACIDAVGTEADPGSSFDAAIK